ncbi:hypothetical protein [Micromonospora sp. HK10]|uniref:hypothetical protein n=1 Tax=Micromonospora sp. HK10 TaxID=1538294 RepID=UPI0012E2B78F|nr:hypothetical protein [Micromonospora sp. HK10]
MAASLKSGKRLAATPDVPLAYLANPAELWAATYQSALAEQGRANDSLDTLGGDRQM